MTYSVDDDSAIGELCFGDYWMVALVVAPEVEHVYVVAPSGDQVFGPRIGGGTRAPVTTDSDCSLAAFGMGGD